MASWCHKCFWGVSHSQKTRKYRHAVCRENKALLLLKDINVHIKQSEMLIRCINIKTNPIFPSIFIFSADSQKSFKQIEKIRNYYLLFQRLLHISPHQMSFLFKYSPRFCPPIPPPLQASTVELQGQEAVTNVSKVRNISSAWYFGKKFEYMFWKETWTYICKNRRNVMNRILKGTPPRVPFPGCSIQH